MPQINNKIIRLFISKDKPTKAKPIKISETNRIQYTWTQKLNTNN